MARAPSCRAALARRKPKDATIEDLAQVQFKAVPNARDWGGDRKSWAENSEAARQAAVLAGATLAMSRAELIRAARGFLLNDTVEAWKVMVDCMDEQEKRHRGFADTMNAARLRQLAAMAAATETEEAPA